MTTSNPFESSGYAPLDERPGRAHFDAQGTSANTNDLRGKLLRIKPQPDGTYSIPAGNLFAPGEMGTRPEIYAMGFRNAFRFTRRHRRHGLHRRLRSRRRLARTRTAGPPAWSSGT